MKSLYFYKLWLFIGMLLVAIVLFFSFAYFEPGTAEFEVPHADKVFHFLSYSSLGYWFSQCFFNRFFKRTLILLFVMGTSIEFLQPFTGYRTFDFFDIVANTIGCLIGIFLSHSFLKNGLSFVDQKLHQLTRS